MYYLCQNNNDRRIKKMAQITLSYNPRNAIAKRTIEYILSLGVFNVTESKKNKAIDEALEEINTGKTVKCDDFEDYLQKVK